MSKKLTLIILAVFLFQIGSSQFLVLPTVKPRADYFHTLIKQTKQGNFQFFAGRDYNNLTTTREKHQILTYNFNGQFVDSANIEKGFVPMSFPLLLNKNYYWSCIYLDTLVTQSPSIDVFILKLDSNFNCIAKKRISNKINTEVEWPSNVILINNKLYMTVKNYTNDDFKIYKLDTLLNKLDSIRFNGANSTEIQKTYDNKILIAGNNFPPTISGGGGGQKVIMDTTLNITSVFNLDSLTYVTAGGTVVTGCSSQIGIVAVSSFKILPITSTKEIILGHYPVVYDANCNDKEAIVHSVVDNNNQILNTQLISDSTKNITYIDNTNFTDFKDNYLYTVGTEGYNYQAGFLQTQNTSILVCKLDTMANLIWKKRYGDDMFYRPVSIITTLDSGLLVSGIRYDAANTMFPGVGQSFILRLDKNGDMISTGIKEIGNSSFESVKVYPNPTKDVIYFDVPFMSNYQIDIYDLLGQSVYSNKEYSNLSSIPTEYLNSGVYSFKIKTNRNSFSGKFIKE